MFVSFDKPTHARGTYIGIYTLNICFEVYTVYGSSALPPSAHRDDGVVVSVGELGPVQLAEGVLHALLVVEVDDASALVVHVGVVHISRLETDNRGGETGFGVIRYFFLRQQFQFLPNG